MNQHLQRILNFIQQEERISAEEKADLSKSLKDADKELEITAFKLDRTEQVKHTTAILLEETIEELEHKRKAVEAQNRELEIETSLERVRTVAMSMNKPADMLEVCRTISTQLESLKVNDIRNVQTAIIYESKGIYLNYEYYRLHDKTFVTEVDYRIHPVQAAFAKKMLADPEGFYTEKFSGKELTDWYEYQKTTPQFADSYLEAATSLNYYWHSVGPVALGISTYSPLSEDDINLFKRFRNVFALAYRRFIDIENAAAQTKEARIEASLERVRAMALSMRKPDDLPGICEVLFTELRELGFAETRNAMINIHDDKNSSFVNYDYSDEIGKSINHLVYNIHPVIEKQIKQIRSGGDAFSETSFKGNDLEDWKAFRKKIGEKDDPRIEKTDALYYYFYSIGTGAIGISTFSVISDEKKTLLKRFRNVFDFAYRRYMDVALAETQAREAQIELALERVRARTMAMQRSEELAETVSVLFKQLLDLGIQSKQLRTCGIVTFNQHEPTGEIWITDTSGEIVSDSFITRYDEAPVYKKIYAAWKKEEKFLVVSLFGDAFYEHINYLLQHTKIPVTDTSFIQKMEPEMHLHVLYFSQGYLFIITYKPLPEHHEIFKRFGAVFQQTYTRFLDFKKAEAQAREAEIELALERVRARTMAMQKSDELRGAVLVIYEQLQQLGFDSNACNIIIIDKESGDMQYWVSGFTQEIFPEGYRVPYLPHPYHEELLAASRQNKQYDVMEYSGEMKKGFDDIFFTQTDFRKIPEEAKSFMKALESVKLSTAFFTCGALQVLGPAELTAERAKILKRFAKVFDLTYTRFLDLQKAEAQARESKIEAALERVRARSMAMHKSDELVEASDTMFDVLRKLQIETIRVGIGIIDTVNDKVEIWSRFEKNKNVEDKVRGIVPASVSVVFDNMLKSKKEKKAYTIITLRENEVKKHYQTLSAYLSYHPQKVYNKKESFHSFYFAEGSLNVVSHEQLNDEECNIMLRFAKVFGQMYRRFLDLQKAEAQAREAQIEASLERVRSKTMAMHNSNEVGETVITMFAEFMHLGIYTNRCGILIFDDANIAEVWTARSTPEGNAKLIIGNLDLDAHKMLRSIYNAWKAKETFYQYDLLDDDLKNYYNAINNSKFYPTLFDLNALPVKEFHSDFLFRDGAVFSFTNEPVQEAYAKIIKRFALIFGQTYRRYLDLQKAEAQAREAQIQLALERVRAKTMAMQKSDELGETAAILFQQLGSLDLKFWSAGVFIWNHDQNVVENWMGNNTGGTPLSSMLLRFKDDDKHRKIYEASVRGELIYEEELSGEALAKHYEWMKSHPSARMIFEQLKRHGINLPSAQWNYAAIFKQGYLLIIAEQPVPGINDISKRFAKVFEQTYTRFLDLQKAEAQAREAKIETTLERVRSRTMAMQHSDELKEAAALLFQQVISLGVPAYSCGYNIWEKNDKEFTSWMSSQDGSIINGVSNIPLTEDANFIRYVDSKQKGEQFFVLELRGKRMQEHYQYLKSIPAFKAYFEYAISVGFDLPETQIHHLANFSQGNLLFITLEPCPEFHDVFKRFAAVFEQTYTRFLDLQKAEAQVLEARIEAALEKVRSRSLAMHTANELGEVVTVIVEKLKDLGVVLDANGVVLCTYFQHSKDVLHWIVSPDFSMAGSYLLPYFDHPIFNAAWQSKENGDEYFSKAFSVAEKNSFFEYAFEHSDYRHFPDEFKQWIFQNDQHILSFAWQKNSAILIPSHTGVLPSEEDIAILKRFAKVFEQSYVRFLDLQKAEEQARESQIQLALERVRARTMAMQKSDELPETSFLLFQQVKELGETTVQNSIGIVNEEAGFVELSTTVRGHNLPRRLNVPIDDPYVMAKAVAAWKANRKSLKLEFVGQELKTYNEHRNSFFETKVNFPEDQWIVNIIFFSKGWLSFSSDKNISVETFELLKRFAAVFEQTYIRFNDLKQAEEQARESQIQLALERVRARAMAMQHSEELSELVAILFNELIKLDLILARCIIWIFDSDNFSARVWMANSEDKKNADSYFIKRLNHPYYEAIINGWKERNPKWVFELDGEYKRSLDELLLRETELSRLPDAVKAGIRSFEHTIVSGSFNNFGFIEASGPVQHSEDQLEILNRFGKVFDLSYTRFNDLKKAEAQTREAQIELGLERVRARAMAMQGSDELKELIGTVFIELTKLDFVLTRCLIMIFDPSSNASTWWMANSEAPTDPIGLYIKYHEHAPYLAYIKAWQEKILKYQYILEGDVKKEWDDFLFVETELSKLPDFVIAGMKAPDRVYLNASFNSFGNLTLATLDPLSEEHFDILLRFANVFDLTYTRFNDLKQAEAQAREAQIEAALERVRSRTMGMQKSEELKEVIQVVYEQFVHLNIHVEHTGFVMDYKTRDDYDIWIADQLGVPSHVTIPYFDCVYYNRFNEAKNKGEDFFASNLDFEEKNRFYQKIIEYVPGLSEETKEFLFNIPGLAGSTVLLENVCLYIENFSGIPFSDEENNTLMRFGKVFQQTYTRFLDLQKAEVQAREAKIEAALERTRTQSMLMQHSGELDTTLRIFHQQLELLDIHSHFTFLWLPEEEKDEHIFWATWEEEKNGSTIIQSKTLTYPLDRNERYTAECLLDWKSGIPVHIYKVPPAEVENYFAAWRELLSGAEKLKAEYFPDGLDYVEAYMKYGCFGIVNTRLLSEDEKDILRRFAVEFERTYTRFLDLQKSEAQAREAQIELALERVRARTMAMQKSEELSETAYILYQQFKELRQDPEQLTIGINNEQKRVIEIWSTLHGNEMKQMIEVSIDEPLVTSKVYAAWKKKQKSLVIDLSGKELKDYNDYRNSLKSGIRVNNDRTEERRVINIAFFSKGQLSISAPEPLSEEGTQLLQRFAKVFEQTYTRFLDLQKAEAQAREAQIEAALEKVRSRSLAMHKSDELQEVVHTVFERLKELNVDLYTAIIFIFAEGSKDVVWWLANKANQQYSRILVPYADNPYLEDIFQAKENGKDFFSASYSFEEKNKLFQHLFEYTDFKYVDETQKKFLLDSELATMSVALTKNIGINITSYTRTSFSEKDNEILKRFAKVFEQSYTRFLDLQKAEAQAKESKIEAALERVRSRTMAMQHSEELGEAASLLFNQIADLGTKSWSSGFNIWQANEASATAWMSKPDGSIGMPFIVPYTEDPFFRQIYEARQSGTDFFVMESGGKELEETYRYMFNLTDAKKHLDSIENLGFEMPAFQITHCAFFSQGYLMFITYEPAPELWDIFKRFSKVFEQTYTRFLDLQKAEAQTRHAQIETAMEKVRARALAMQQPDELVEVAQVLRKEMGLLGVEELETSSIYIHDESSGGTECWYAIKKIQDDEKKLVTDHMTIKLLDTWVGRKMLDFYNSDKKQISIPMQGANRKEWIHYCTKHSTAIEGFYGENIPDRTYHLNKFSNGYIGAASPGNISAESWELLQRATTVFSLAYTRFNDLQRSAASARDAVRRASLDRVRAETASMRTTSDLEKITPLIWNELTIQGVPFIRCGVFIMDDQSEQVHTFLSTPDGNAIAAFHLSYATPGTVEKVVAHWRSKQIFKDHWDEAAFLEWSRNLVQQGAIPSSQKYLTDHPPVGLDLHFFPFLQGMLYVGSETPLENEAMQLVQTLADAFSTAYARYEDFNKLESAKEQIENTLVHLKQAQAQLVQSEKMASLGELTAGIAHEIQNPLNFVNNFSEVNAELIEELKSEWQKAEGERNLQLTEDILNDIAKNEEKIIHHGKRADAIVKGMLQHSRSSSAVKEPTDINKLADEYLRLAYHGLRAKDKSFNATLKTNFDESIGNVNIIPQDIGRVILNLITNAFYAVTEKKKLPPSPKGEKNAAPNEFDPTVSVITKNMGDNVEISVKDNGNGIPQKILDKIFQPFFTTKPTGQGTGLGLSLAYDIVKAHGGELKVETKEGEGTEFIIRMPIV